MKFYVTLGKCKITLKDIMLSIVSGVFISIIILLWQLVGLIERPLVYSVGSFIGSSLGFALLIIGFAGFLGTIEEVRKELQGKDKAMVEQL